MRIGCRSILTAALLLAAAPAHATATTFFGEDLGAFTGTLPFTHTLSSTAETNFRTTLGTWGTEDFHSFDYPDTGPLSLSFRNPPGASGAEVATGTLTDPTGDGFIATAAIAKTGFPISGSTYWKNETDEDEGLFSVAFDSPQRAFGFYATGYSTLSGSDGTELVLDLELEAGGTIAFVIPHSTDFTLGNVFYFGVINDLSFVRATLRNQGDEDGDVIGFDDFTVAAVPEPASGALLAGGLLVLAALRRRRP